jgi:hypothetical protein
MKKIAHIGIVTLVCLGLLVPAFGLQPSLQSSRTKKVPAQKTLPEPDKPPVPKPAPAAPLQAPPVPAAVAVPAAQPMPPAYVPGQPPATPAPAPVPAAAPAVPAPHPLPVEQPASPAPQQAAPAPEPVQLQKEVVKVNYINAQEAHQILMAYRSPRGRIQIQRNRNILIIEDTPDFVDKLLSILKEIDVRPLDLMFTVDVILGSMKEAGGESIPSSDRLLKELKSLLKYEHFTRLDTSLIKVQDNGNTSQRMGGEGIGLLLELYPRHVRDGGKDGFQVELRLLQTTRRQERRDEGGNIEYFASPLEKSLSLLSTSLSLVDGERSVVGVSKLNGGDTALILVIEGKLIK